MSLLANSEMFELLLLFAGNSFLLAGCAVMDNEYSRCLWYGITDRPLNRHGCHDWFSYPEQQMLPVSLVAHT